MTANSAVRGCPDIYWIRGYDTSDPNECLQQCIASGANACEYFADGWECYIEWGNGCYVTGGFDGWYAAVAPFTDGGGGGSTASAYAGCFRDDPDRALPTYFGDGFTVDSCVNTARNAGLGYAGLQYYGHCFASNVLGYSQRDESECNTPCSANPSQMCGGAWRNSVYLTGAPTVSGPPSYTPLPNHGEPE